MNFQTILNDRDKIILDRDLQHTLNNLAQDIVLAEAFLDTIPTPEPTEHGEKQMGHMVALLRSAYEKCIQARGMAAGVVMQAADVHADVV